MQDKIVWCTHIYWNGSRGRWWIKGRKFKPEFWSGLIYNITHSDNLLYLVKSLQFRVFGY